MPIGDIRFGHCYLSEPTIIIHPAIPSILATRGIQLIVLDMQADLASHVAAKH